jgi:hypothetical protein
VSLLKQAFQITSLRLDAADRNLCDGEYDATSPGSALLAPPSSSEVMIRTTLIVCDSSAQKCSGAAALGAALAATHVFHHTHCHCAGRPAARRA